MRSDVLVYLAGPITPKDGYSIEENVAQAVKVFFELLCFKIPAICPHLTALAPSAHQGLVSYEDFLEYDFRLIDRCTHVLLLPRWERSRGSQGENNYAHQMGKTVVTSVAELLSILPAVGAQAGV